MTWEGAGGAGGPAEGQGGPDDATRTDIPIGAPPPPAAPPPGAPQPPAAQPPSPVPPPVPPAVPPGTTPWAPPTTGQAGDAWGIPPAGGGGQYAVPGAPGLIYAGAIPRAAAYIVDGFLLAIIVGIVSIPFAAASYAGATADGIPNVAQYAGRSGLSAVIGALIEGAYFVFLWMSSGRATLGMRLFNLQVGNFADGAKVRTDQAVKRWLAYGSWLSILAVAPPVAGLIGLVTFLWTLVLLFTTATSPTKQGLHDRIAGTAVVRPASAGNGLAIACLLVALVIPFLLLVSLIALVFLGSQVSDILSAVGDSI
jgi:uncharacterized RDD family membrane protein YckC